MQQYVERVGASGSADSTIREVDLADVDNPGEDGQEQQPSPPISRPRPIVLEGSIKGIKDIIHSVSRDYQDVERDIEITLTFSGVTERQLRRLMRDRLLGHRIEASIYGFQYRLVGDEQDTEETSEIVENQYGWCEYHEARYLGMCPLCSDSPDPNSSDAAEA